MSGYKISRDSGYGAPEPSYGAPSSGYDEPVQEYGGYEAAAEGSADLTPILIGILVVTGLALLFPSYVTLTNIRRRRKRSASGGIQGELVEADQCPYFSLHQLCYPS